MDRVSLRLTRLCLAAACYPVGIHVSYIKGGGVLVFRQTAWVGTLRPNIAGFVNHENLRQAEKDLGINQSL